MAVWSVYSSGGVLLYAILLNLPIRISIILFSISIPIDRVQRSQIGARLYGPDETRRLV